jgi:hypothetical protein
MKQTLKIILVLAFTAALFGCGGNDDNQAAETKPAPVTSNPATQKSADKPFAREQQLIREAGKIQGVLDQDAQEKKKAVEEAN